MKRIIPLIGIIVAVIFVLAMAQNGFALDGDKRRGKVYFKMICTVCHMQTIGKPIPPNSRTMAEWKNILASDRHGSSAKAKTSIRYYVSHEYRQSIQDTNKAAAKFMSLPDDEISADVRAFVISGAKDSDTPASCN